MKRVGGWGNRLPPLACLQYGVDHAFLNGEC
jgi:hypothetical protein